MIRLNPRRALRWRIRQGQIDNPYPLAGLAPCADGGLVFIAATNFDRKFRAFDKATGALLWETILPFSGNGTPATYEVDGRRRSRAWVMTRRLTHTSHHRGQQMAMLRMLGRDLHSNTGPRPTPAD